MVCFEPLSKQKYLVNSIALHLDWSHSAESCSFAVCMSGKIRSVQTDKLPKGAAGFSKEEISWHAILSAVFSSFFFLNRSSSP